MDDKDIHLRLIESNARLEQKLSDVHTNVQELKPLAERMIIVEQTQVAQKSDITTLSTALNDHTVADDKNFKAIKRWLMGVSGLLLLTMAGVYGAEKVLGWFGKIFLGN